jgi:hypothetical protein
MNSLSVCMFYWLVKKIVPDTEKKILTNTTLLFVICAGIILLL